METDRWRPREHLLWVNWERGVISFRETEGFEKLVFFSREEKIQFALEKSEAGFGIQ